MKYEYRYTEIYKGVRIDIRSHTKKEEHEKVKRKKEQIDVMPSVIKSLKLVGEEYLTVYKKPAVSERWYAANKSIFYNHILKGIGDVPVASITAMDVQMMLNSGSFCNDFTSKIFNLTKQILKHAYRQNYITKDISESIIKPKGEKTKAGRSLTEKEEPVFLDCIIGSRSEMIFKLMYYCGLRVGEARETTWQDLDLDSGTIHIRGTKSANADRYVPIPDVLCEELKKIRKRSGYVSENDVQRVQRDWNAVKREMNIRMGCTVYRNKLVPPFPVREPLRLYDLRHTYCTNLEKAGVPISIAARLMGHSDISLTANIYTHESDTAIEMARSLINKSAL